MSLRKLLYELDNYSQVTYSSINSFTVFGSVWFPTVLYDVTSEEYSTYLQTGLTRKKWNDLQKITCGYLQ